MHVTDTANHYHNQVGVARGIADSGVPRGAFWLQTKVEPCGHSTITPVLEGHCYNGTVGAFQQNLQQLNVPQVDLTLLHAPPCVPNSSWADPMCYWPDQPDAIYPQHANCSAPEACRMMRAQWKALEDMCVRACVAVAVVAVVVAAAAAAAAVVVVVVVVVVVSSLASEQLNATATPPPPTDKPPTTTASQ